MCAVRAATGHCLIYQFHSLFCGNIENETKKNHKKKFKVEQLLLKHLRGHKLGIIEIFDSDGEIVCRWQ